MSYAVQLAYRSINTIPPPGLINGVAGATYANPIVITSTYSVITGDMISISGVLGNPAANGTWPATYVDSTHFSIPVAGNGTYTGGGNIANAQMVMFHFPYADANQWKRAFIDHDDMLDWSHLQDVLGRHFRLLLHVDPTSFNNSLTFFEGFLTAKYRWANYGRFADAANFNSLCAAVLENDEEVFTTEYYLKNGIMLKSSKIYP